MNMLCFIGVHKWDGCMCTTCGKTRDEGHDWNMDCEKCAKCGVTRHNAHDWTKDCQKCSKCGAVRKRAHDWTKDCEKCVKCGTTRVHAHNWTRDCEECVTCGVTRQNVHKWSDCKCTICGKISHKWDGCKCLVCGKIRNQGHIYPTTLKEAIDQLMIDRLRGIDLSEIDESLSLNLLRRCKKCGKIQPLDPPYQPPDYPSSRGNICLSMIPR
jgi:hypothetical protein